MDKFVKINSVQGGAFTTSSNLVDFVIPASMGVVDLKDSYINLNTRITTTETSTDGGDGVYAVGVQWKYSGSGTEVHPKFVNSALVKNCHIRSDQRGQLENVRRVDQLRQLLSTYTRSQREAFSDSYLASNQLIDPVNRNQFGIFREINKTGSIKSRDLEISPVQISLADLFGFCDSAPEVDLMKLGTLRVHLELNRDQIEPVIRMNEVTTWANTDLGDMEDITALGSANEVVTKQKFTNLDLSPFWVGQALEISATHTDGGASDIQNKRVVVESITWDKDNGGVLKIAFTADWGTLVAGKTYSSIKVIPYYKDASTPTTINVSADLSVDSAELVVKRVGNPVGIDQIDYDTFSTEETNGLGLKSFQNQYQIEPDAKDILIAFPSDDNDLVSVNNDITDFRLRLNNQDLTDRPVEVDEPLYYDRINMTLGNMGERLKNLTQNTGEPSEGTWGDVYDQTEFDVVSIQNPLFITEREKYLQVNINAGGSGVNKLTLFKHLPRSIEL
tara:strand:+ start:301 stop:1812 length:1512 start_codon:yes stop_codon:yes gene_type:complete